LPSKLNYTTLRIAVHSLKYLIVQLQPYKSAQTTDTTCAWSHPQEVLKGCQLGWLVGWLVTSSYKAQTILCYHYQLNKNT